MYRPFFMPKYSRSKHTRSSGVAEIQHKSGARVFMRLVNSPPGPEAPSSDPQPPLFDKHAFEFCEGKFESDNYV